MNCDAGFGDPRAGTDARARTPELKQRKLSELSLQFVAQFSVVEALPEAVEEVPEELVVEALPEAVEEVPEEPVVEALPEAVEEVPADPWVSDGSETQSGAPATALDTTTQTPPRPRIRKPTAGGLGARDL